MLSTLSSKGQLIIPEKIRKRLNLKKGNKLEFDLTEDNSIFIRPVKDSFKKLKGMVPPSEKHLSEQEIDSIIKKLGCSSY